MILINSKNLQVFCFILLTAFTCANASANDYNNAKSAFDNGNTEEAITIWKELANQGDTRSQFALGAIYATGNTDISPNDAESIKWFRMAAEQGHTVAQYNLGNAYERGRGVQQSNEQAVQWWQQAADQGHAPAQFNLGTHYFFGRGVDQDSKQAENLWYKAALQNHAPAQFNLATLYKYGPDEVKNNQKAMHWYRIAARNGHQGAQQFLLNDATNTGEANLPKTVDNNNTNSNQTNNNTGSSTSIAAVASQKPKPLPEPEVVTDQKIEPKPVEPKQSDVKIIGAPRTISTQSVTTDNKQESEKVTTSQTENTSVKSTQVNKTLQAAKAEPNSDTPSKAKTPQSAEKSTSTTKPAESAENTVKSKPAQKTADQNNTNAFAFTITHREDWIKQQNSQNYTLQLAAFRSEKQVIEFLKEHDVNGDTAYFKFNRDNTDWYAVLYGSYASSAQAKSQISNLPQSLQKSSPWLRRFSAVQKLIN